ncbi:Arylacetonitrilase [Colletotrichum sp. SAR 10_99]|nr:Arylacetonitrilase [Colletotrichum sp. SAR 10_96]KAJ5016612.1 Arylacetonitrilase [Colletotrichum sp. SAR 10_99]
MSVKPIRVAAVQAEGCYFDLEAAVEKTCKLIEEAAGKGCDLIAFPEVWIPNYPVLNGCNRQRPIDFDMVKEYMKSSLKRDGPEMARICACAGKNKIAVMVGYSENANHSLYLSQSFIGKDGEIKMNRRKIKPTHVERTLYGDGSGASLHNVVEEPGIGKVGALSCWEHSQPLLRYHTYSQGEEIHVAAWPPMNYFNSFPEGSALWSQCREGMCLKNLYTNLSQALTKLGDGKLYHIGGGGCACIIAPDGRKLTEDLREEEEGLVIADINLDEIMKVKAMLDVHGHYSRPDLLWLGVDSREKKQVRREAELLDA